ncbi:kinesin [Novymonas esmeraldas]|uniref:Kinesin n=1 Tax=Novymonas esmeraldas TaxID=1808958 RepID=A0AAW0EV83_9TRYP
MKVFCRFSPAPAEHTAVAGRPAAAAAAAAEPVLLLHAEGPPLSTSASPPPGAPTTGTRVRIADPSTLSKAAFSCDGVFLPAKAEQQQQQQQLLYHTTCGALLAREPAAPVTQRLAYLAYGQTASGKTYSLFGHGGDTSPPLRLLPTAGVVPRFLHELFTRGSGARSRVPAAPPHRRRRGNSDDSDARGGVAAAAQEDIFVDLRCLEVYNETTTDLVALAVVQSLASDDAHHTAAAARHRGLRHSSVSGGATAHSPRCADRRPPQQRPVWVAHHRYRSEQEQLGSADAGALDEVWGACSETSAGGPGSGVRHAQVPPFIKTEYKATEKLQVMRSLERARCTTLTEALTVLHTLLALRHACSTHRNESSSRGHLVLCMEAYAPVAPTTTADDDADGGGGVWAMQCDTAFVDLAGSESAALTEADTHAERASSEATRVVRRRPPQRVRGVAAGAAAAASSRASSLHSRASLDASLLSGTSSLYGGGGGGSGSSTGATTTTTTASAYHRSLLRGPQEEEESATAAHARRRRETRCINASLLALRKVFRVLHDVTRRTTAAITPAPAPAPPRRPPPLHHAPFKDSALTTILQPFLAPPCSAASSSSAAAAAHVVLLVCCSSRSVDFFETVASLRLGAEATAVNPEVVLRALPVQQHEQQQKFAHAAASSRVTRHLPASYGDGPVQQARIRSASAPTRRLAGSSLAFVAVEDEDEDEDDTDRISSRGIRGGRATAGEVERRPRDEAAAAAAVVADDRLRVEAARYKETAQQLYKQCKSLCESYDECVEELRRSREALARRDARVAELEAALAEQTRMYAAGAQPHQLQEMRAVLQVPPRSTRLVDSSGVAAASAVASPAARTPHAAHRHHRSGDSSSSSGSSSRGNGAADTGEASPLLIRGRRVSGERREGGTGALHSATMSTAAVRQPHVAECAAVSPSAREGSARWMVSVSPFSTASGSVARAGGGGASSAREPMNATAVEDSGGCVDSGDCAQAERAVACDEGASSTESAGRRCCEPQAPNDEQQQQQQQQQKMQQHGHHPQRAQSIMHTLLARQILTAAAPVEPTPSPSPPRACSASASTTATGPPATPTRGEAECGEAKRSSAAGPTRAVATVTDSCADTRRLSSTTARSSSSPGATGSSSVDGGGQHDRPRRHDTDDAQARPSTCAAVEAERGVGLECAIGPASVSPVATTAAAASEETADVVRRQWWCAGSGDSDSGADCDSSPPGPLPLDAAVDARRTSALMPPCPSPTGSLAALTPTTPVLSPPTHVFKL